MITNYFFSLMNKCLNMINSPNNCNLYSFSPNNSHIFTFDKYCNRRYYINLLVWKISHIWSLSFHWTFIGLVKKFNSFRAKNPQNNASVLLRLFNDDFANKFEIQDAINNRQVIWFRAEVPVRQWNSMCLIRKFREKFQIYQNNENVYSYGECRTVGPINDYYPTQVKDKPCHDKPKWYLNVSCKKRKYVFLIQNPILNPNPPLGWRLLIMIDYYICTILYLIHLLM